jgi:hypothetical protein
MGYSVNLLMGSRPISPAGPLEPIANHTGRAEVAYGYGKLNTFPAHCPRSPGRHTGP